MTIATGEPARLERDAGRPHGGRQTDYRAVAKALHWTIAALVFAMAASGVTMTQLGAGPTADFLFGAHKLTGVIIVCLVLLRLSYRIVWNARSRWRTREASVHAHRLLYAVVIATPLLGWAGVSDFGARTALFGIELPAIWPEGAGYSDLLLSAHGWLAFGLLALVCIHIGLALQDYITRGQGS